MNKQNAIQKKKNVVFPLTLWKKNRVGRSEIILFTFFIIIILFPIQVNSLQIQTQL
jgi:hypothetical protein